MNTPLSMASLLRSSIGFDRFNDLFETALRDEPSDIFPPYNVEKHADDTYRIVIAAAGFREEDLDLQVEKGVLSVRGSYVDPNDTQASPTKDITYLHQGIATHNFRLSFRLADHVDVKQAALVNGLLTIDLLRTVPEEAKPKHIPIGGEAKPAIEH